MSREKQHKGEGFTVTGYSSRGQQPIVIGKAWHGSQDRKLADHILSENLKLRDKHWKWEGSYKLPRPATQGM